MNKELYKDAIKTEFGVELQPATFNNNNKWSKRMRETFLSQGKRWTDSMASKVKYLIAKKVMESPGNALNEHNRGAIDSLIISLEEKIAK